MEKSSKILLTIISLVLLFSVTFLYTDVLLALQCPLVSSMLAQTKKLHAKRLADFLAQRDILPDKVDLIVVCGNEYLQSVDEALRLYLEGRSDRIVFTGGVGHSTANLIETAFNCMEDIIGQKEFELSPSEIGFMTKIKNDRIRIKEDGGTKNIHLSEAEIMAGIFRVKLRQKGYQKEEVDKIFEKIDVESESANAQENARFTQKSCEDVKFTPRSVILIQMPTIQRRSGLTFKKQGNFFNGVKIYNHAAYIPDEELTDERFIKVLMDETQKLINYPKPAKGYIVALDIPGLLPGKLPDDIEASLNMLRTLIYPGSVIKVGGKFVAYHLKVGEKVMAETMVGEAQTGRYVAGSSFKNFSCKGYQGVFYLKKGMAEVKVGNYTIILKSGDLVVLFGDSNIDIKEESQCTVARQMSKDGTDFNPREKIKGESGGSIKKGKDVVARVFRDPDKNLLAVIHRKNDQIKNGLVYITPRSAPMGIAIVGGQRKGIVTGAEGAFESMVSLSGLCKMKFTYGGRSESIDVEEGSMVVAYPLTEHSYQIGVEGRPSTYAVFTMFPMKSHLALDSRYNVIHREFETGGVDVTMLARNRDYTDADGWLYTSANPFISYWPLDKYEGGSGLLNNISLLREKLKKEFPGIDIAWTKPGYLHSTVFNVRKSLAPEVSENSPSLLEVSRHAQDIISEFKTQPYVIKFNNFLISHDGSILVVGYISDGLELAKLKDALKSRISGGHRPNIIHITLGRIMSAPSPEEMVRLKEFVRNNMDQVFGAIKVDSITCAMYRGPVTDPKIEDAIILRFDDVKKAPEASLQTQADIDSTGAISPVDIKSEVKAGIFIGSFM